MVGHFLSLSFRKRPKNSENSYKMKSNEERSRVFFKTLSNLKERNNNNNKELSSEVTITEEIFKLIQIFSYTNNV